MLNPILQNSQMPKIKNLIKTIRLAQNPNAYLQQMISRNPQMQQVMEFSKAFSSPKEAFYAAAKKQGINAEEFMHDLFS